MRNIVPGASFLSSYRSKAGGWKEVQDLDRRKHIGPLAIISSPLYAPDHGGPVLDLEPFEVPVPKSFTPSDAHGLSNVGFEKKIARDAISEYYQSGWDKGAFRNLLAKKSCFSIGGTKLITEFGIRASWLRESQIRLKTSELIVKRNWVKLLSELKSKELDEHGSLSLIGQKDISEFFSALRPVGKLQENRGDISHPPQPKRRQEALSLRLRKAIELITSIEVVLHTCFNSDPPKLTKRFEKISGLPSHCANAKYIWNHLWIEPIIYVVSPRPHPLNVERIVQTESQYGNFEAATGQNASVLYRVLFGAPRSWNVCTAAADACNRFFGISSQNPTPVNKPIETRAVTVNPNEYDRRRKLLYSTDIRVEGQSLANEYLYAQEDLRFPGVVAADCED